MAARFWRGTGDGNWGSTGNWSATSGGATGASVPGVADDVTFDVNGNNNCTINASARSCKTLTITSGYTATITHTQQLTVAGNITLHNGYTIAGSGLLVISASSTIVTGGKIWPNSVTLSSTSGLTYTINTNTFQINGTLTIGTGATTTFAGSFGFNCTNLSIPSISAITVTLKDGTTYAVSGQIYVYLSRTGSNVLITSSHASNKAILTVSYGAEIRLNCAFTRIDASAGRPLRTFNGVVTDCDYIQSFYDLKTAAA